MRVYKRTEARRSNSRVKSLRNRSTITHSLLCPHSNFPQFAVRNSFVMEVASRSSNNFAMSFLFSLARISIFSSPVDPQNRIPIDRFLRNIVLLIDLFFSSTKFFKQPDKMDIMSMNGGSAIAMKGDGCVTIGSDLRLGSRFLTIMNDKEKIYKFGDRLYLGLSGLATDAQTIVQRLTYRKNAYELRENRPMKPKTFTHMLSNMLYEKRFGPYFCEPIVAGLDPITFEPYIASTDTIGCISAPEDFVAVGTGQFQMAGTCESYWEKNMDPDSLFEATAQSLLASIDRDAASGMGAVVYTITKDEISVKTLKARLE